MQATTQIDRSPFAPSHHAQRHSQKDLNRLIEQARFFGDLARHVLQLAGLGPGMRVLDIGCGTGGVTFVAAEMVGPTGMVIGVDKAPEAIALAEQCAVAAGLTHVHFVTEELAEHEPEGAFDALIGSRILMYFTDPAVLLRRLLKSVVPGGIVAFQEFDLEGAKSVPRSPLFEESFERVRQTFRRAGADGQAGLKLAQIFEEAGLSTPEMLMAARVEKGAHAEVCEQLAMVSRALLPLMERLGVATAAEVGIETLAGDLREDARAHDSTLVAPPLIGAWTRTEKI